LDSVVVHLQPLIEKRLASGEYRSAEEVFRRALEILEAQETWTEQHAAYSTKKTNDALGQIEDWKRRTAPSLRSLRRSIDRRDV